MNEQPGNTPMFQISRLVKEFNSVPAVNDVTTQIDRGEVVFIVGPSGSGKSTFLRCLNLLEEPTSGEILFKGELVTSPARTSTSSAGTWAWSSSTSTFSRT